MAYSFDGISNSVKDVLQMQTTQFKRELAEPALISIQIAKQQLHTAYVQQLMSKSVMQQMKDRVKQKKELAIMEQKKEQMKKEYLEFHQKNLGYLPKRNRNQTIYAQVGENWEKYHDFVKEYKEQESKLPKIFASKENRDLLRQPIIDAIRAIEQARDVFQKPILYKIALYDNSNPAIVQEVEMNFNQLVENNLISISAKNTDNLLNSLSVRLSMSQAQYQGLIPKMQLQQKLSSLQGADANYILYGQIGNELYDTKVNRGWRYQWYLEGLAGRGDNKQDNLTWSAGPDVNSKGRYNYSAKFLSFYDGYASVQISSLVSIFGSLEAYEAKLKYALGKTPDPKIDIEKSVEQFRQNILNSLTKQWTTQGKV